MPDTTAATPNPFSNPTSGVDYIPTPVSPVGWQSDWSTFPAVSGVLQGLTQPVEVPKKGRKRKKKDKLYNQVIFEAFKSYSQNQGGMEKQEGEVGLEIECEGMNLFDAPISYWQTHIDPSLRAVDGHQPIEYVLRKPLLRQDIPKA